MGPRGNHRTMAATIIDQCASLHAGGIVSSCPYSAFFDTIVRTPPHQRHGMPMAAVTATLSLPIAVNPHTP